MITNAPHIGIFYCLSWTKNLFEKTAWSDGRAATSANQSLFILRCDEFYYLWFLFIFQWSRERSIPSASIIYQRAFLWPMEWRVTSNTTSYTTASQSTVSSNDTLGSANTVWAVGTCLGISAYSHVNQWLSVLYNWLWWPDNTEHIHRHKIYAKLADEVGHMLWYIQAVIVKKSIRTRHWKVQYKY